ncbi:MAG: SBBP repeat-containing protein [Fimbriimonadaceae bacterium]|nr:SBBP repeat-containing protein [Fimbriimonadaceae bacterium]QYK54735.1 MAG: SBBP repeat-containing protein [Fimbriimonadaceae bacterium]
MNWHHRRVLAAFGLATALVGPFAHAQSPDVNKAVAESKVSFRENRGQWDTKALFVSQLPGLDYWVTRKGLVLDFHQTVQVPGKTGAREAHRQGQVVSFELRGAAEGAPKGFKPTSDVASYFVGGPSRHAAEAKAYAQAQVSNIRPNVDLMHYHDKGRLRYDVVVRPGGNPLDVVFDVKGANGIEIGKDGDLYLKTSVGTQKVGDLYTYQVVNGKRREVSSEFYLQSNASFGVRVGDYDRNLPLVIDPLIYGTYLGSTGGDNNDRGVASAVDSRGNIYVAGTTTSLEFPINVGLYNRVVAEGADAFLIRINQLSMKVEFSGVLGGSGDESVAGLQIDRTTGSLWLAGTSTSANFPGVVGDPKGNNERVFVTKFDVNLGVVPQFTRFVNDIGAISVRRMYDVFGTSLRALRVSRAGTVYLCGNQTTASLVGFDNYLPNTVTGNQSGFLVALDTNGVVKYKRQIGGGVGIRVYGMDVNANDEPVVIATIAFDGVEDTSIANPPTFRTTAGVYDLGPQFQSGRFMQGVTAGIVKFGSNGSCLWAATLGGTLVDYGMKVAYGPSGDVFAVCYSNSFNYPITNGAFGNVGIGFGAGRQLCVTKLAPDASTIRYSTGLNVTNFVWRDDENPILQSLRVNDAIVDGRDQVVIVGEAGFILTTGPNPAPSVPVRLPITPDAIDADYTDGAETVDASNTPPDPTGFPSSTDGFYMYVAPGGDRVTYCSYVGASSNDTVNSAHLDPAGLVWFTGTSSATQSFAGFRTPFGIAPHVTTNADRNFMTAGGGTAWAFKFKPTGLPVLRSIALGPATVAGGNGSTSVARVTLSDPAPIGGVRVDLRLTNASKTSFSQTPGVTTSQITIPEGETFGDATIYTSSVTTLTTSDIIATLDLDSIQARLTLLPWLSEFNVSPPVVSGGNPITATVILNQAAPPGGVRITVATDQPEAITLPSPAVITVPEGATFASVQMATRGVAQDTVATINATYLGVGKTKQVTILRSFIQSLVFDPVRVNGGETSTGTVTLSGAASTARTITISRISGVNNVKVNGVALPVNVTVPANQKSVDFTVTTARVTQETSITMRASDGNSQANGTLLIDDIDIADVVVSGTDVVGGTDVRCQILLTRPAGPSGFTVQVSNSNSVAGRLNRSSVTIRPGEIVSPEFLLLTNVVKTDQNTNVNATRAGFSTKFKSVKVRAITLTLEPEKTRVTGGLENIRCVARISRAAAAGGVDIDLSSTDSSIKVPTSVNIGQGKSAVAFTMQTSKVPVQRQVRVRASIAGSITADVTITLDPVALQRLTFDPDIVVAGTQTRGTLTFESGVAAGTTVTLSASPDSAVTMPSSVTVTSGARQFSFVVRTRSVAQDTVVTVTANRDGDIVTGQFTVQRPSVFSVTFNPTRVRGGATSVGTVTLEQAAGAGGVQVKITSNNTAVARVVGSDTITIPQGQKSGTFNVQTLAVSRSQAVNFTVQFGNGQNASGSLFVDP